MTKEELLNKIKNIPHSLTAISDENGRYHVLYKISQISKPDFYIGKHSSMDFNDDYFGSGIYLRSAIKKYGRKDFKKEIICFFNNEIDSYLAEETIINEEFILREDTFNIKIGGYGYALGYISVKDKDGVVHRVKTDDPKILSGELMYLSVGRVSVKDKDGNTFQVDKNDPRYLSGELVSFTKGKTNAKDKDGNIYFIDVDDPRVLSGELVGATKGKVNVKDKNGIKYFVNKDDPKIFSGEYEYLTSFDKDKISAKDIDGKIHYINKDDPRFISGELFSITKGKIPVAIINMRTGG